MFVFLLQAALLLAIAYILGAVVGCLMRTQFGERPATAVARKPAPQSASGTGAIVAPAPAGMPVTETEPPARAAPKPKAPGRTKLAVAKKSPAATAATAAAEKKPAEPQLSETDDLKRIKGIGPQIETKLNAAGISRYEQIAKWTKKDVAEFGEKLSFAGRIEREDWVAQAKKLARG